MDMAKSAPTPMNGSINNSFEKAASVEVGQERGQVFMYRELEGSLLYMSTHTGPRNIFTVNV